MRKICTVHVNGEAWPYCPRTILQRQLARAKEQGYLFNVGVEAEFMLLQRTEQGDYMPWDTLDTLGKPCYDLRALHRNLDVIRSRHRPLSDTALKFLDLLRAATVVGANLKS